MNTEKVFARMLKAKAKGVDVSVVTDYNSTKELIKYVLAMPDTYIVDVEIGEPNWKGYDDPYLLTLDVYGGVFCQPVILTSGKPARGTGLYFIDVLATDSWQPSDFVLDDPDAKIKLIGGENE